MVHRARNTHRDIYIGVYRLARKPHLQFIRQIITIHYLSRCGYTRVYFFGELLYFRYSLPRAVAYAYNNFVLFFLGGAHGCHWRLCFALNFCNYIA